MLNDVFVMNIGGGTGAQAAGGSEPQKILSDAGFPTLMPDGRVVYSTHGDGDALWEIHIANVNGSGVALLINDENFFPWMEAVVNPGGTKIAVTRLSFNVFKIAVDHFNSTSAMNLLVAPGSGGLWGTSAPPGRPAAIAWRSPRTGQGISTFGW